MTNLASQLLTEERFWDIILRSLDGTDSVGLEVERQERLLEQELERLSCDEFTGFLGHFYSLHQKAYRNDLWAVAYAVMGGCSDDCFMDFRTWLILRGESVYNAALRNPDSLCPEFDKIPQGDIPLCEIWCSFPTQYDRRLGERAHDKAWEQIGFSSEEKSDPENQWRHDDEVSIRNLCPAVFDAYWGNVRF